ncbi:hypothetical protein LT85_2583 [Collimonas arenae]|uniref:Uncharacterized protein n=1 Tax=Collimonas arenae TaxID=279058 RepID=A0A0A1FB77_9BURK|nr:hypothetical protein [Collimonas arenae]AIY41741.1 hypothetical protein LT85_2583 [Collimonas arenae]
MTSPLTLMMPVIPGTSLDTIATALAGNSQKIDDALNTIGTVHFARFLVLDRGQPNLQPTGAASNTLLIGVVTEYDGNFNSYISDFVGQLGPVFDKLLSFVVGGAALIPVASNVAAFQAYITVNDASQHVPNNTLYAAYPQTVQQIRAAF